MVNKDVLQKISRRLTELCDAHGVTSNLEVQNLFDNECDIRIPTEVANEKRDELIAICDGLRSIDEIDDIFDRGKDRVIRGDDYRQFEILVKDGAWTHSDADEKAEAEIMREYFDEEFAKKKDAERMKSRREHWHDYILPLPKPDGNKNTELYLTMAYEPYDWIDRGYDENGKHLYKRCEFRAYNDYYNKKLLSHPIKTVKFQRGYGGPGRGKPQQMKFEVESIMLWDSHQKMECDPLVPRPGIVPDFFVINLGKRIT